MVRWFAESLINCILLFLSCGLISAKVSAIKSDNNVTSLKWNGSKVQWNEQAWKKEGPKGCQDDERCVFTWACPHIAQPVRQCATPGYYKLAVCCRMGHEERVAAPKTSTISALSTTTLPSTTGSSLTSWNSTTKRTSVQKAVTTTVVASSTMASNKQTTTMEYSPGFPSAIHSFHSLSKNTIIFGT